MPVSQIPVGDQAYLWKLDKAQEHCMISSHGGPASPYTGAARGGFYPTFTVPANVWLVFYGPHGETLVDDGFEKMLAGDVRPYEILGPGETCHNYGLWKWQGYHQSMASCLFGKPSQPFVSDITEDYKRIKYALEQREIARNAPASFPVADALKRHMDIATIRYRPFRSHTTLKAVVTELQHRGYKYIHCNFCRGITGGHQVSTNPPSPTIRGSAPPSTYV